MAPEFKLAAWMDDKPISLAELEERSGVNRCTLIDMRLGRRKPRPSTVRQVAAALRLSVEMLRKGPPQKKRKAA